jgi:hypothetical protein
MVVLGFGLTSERGRVPDDEDAGDVAGLPLHGGAGSELLRLRLLRLQTSHPAFST